MAQFHHAVGQEPQAPSLPALRRIGARKSNEVRLGSPVQNPPPGPAGLLGHKRYLQAFLAKAPPLACHRGSGELKSLGDSLVGPAVGTIGVGLEKYASVEQFALVRPATAHERFESA